jgi:hypothetical protein
MKKNIILLLAAILAAPLCSAAGFEGTVTMKLTSRRETAPQMTYSIKGPSTRIDLTAADKGGRVAMLMDSTKTEMTILMLDQKMFMTQPMLKVAGATSDAAGATSDASIEKTSVTEKILGYDCVKYLSKSKATVTEIWVTDQLGSFSGLGGGNPMGGGMGKGRGSPPSSEGQAWEKALGGLNVFPLRVVSTEAGKESFRLEVTSIEKKSLADSMFVPPADFQDLSGMMRGMGLPPGMKLPGGN